MSAATDFLEAAVLNHTLNSIAWASPTSIEIGLSTTTPNEDGTNFTEPSGLGYARQTPSGSPPFAIAAGSGDKMEASNVAILSFPIATGSWGTLTHFGVFDQLGNLLIAKPLGSPITIGAGEFLRFPIGELKVTLN